MKSVAYAAYAAAILTLFAAISAGIFLSAEKYPEDGVEELLPQEAAAYHAHADFLVVVNGSEINFSVPEYDEAYQPVHLHLRNYGGDRVLHIESRRATIGDFFRSINIAFSRNCLVIGERYCSGGAQSLKFYVNGESNGMFEKYAPKDMDRILVIYGNETDGEAARWSDSVSSLSCVFSLKCAPPAEAENRIIYN